MYIFFNVIMKFYQKIAFGMDAAEPKWVNSNYILYGVNSIRLGDQQMIFIFLDLFSA